MRRFAILLGCWLLLSAAPCPAQDFQIGEFRAVALYGPAGLVPETDYVSFTGDFGFAGALPAIDALDRHVRAEAALLKHFAVSVINVEFMLPGSTGREQDQRIDDVMLGVLTSTGFDVVSRANNHAVDFGIDGHRHNLRRLREAGLAAIGVRTSPVYRAILGGSRVAIFALTDSTDRPDPDRLILRIDAKDLETVKMLTTDADFRIAFVHMGSISAYPSPHERQQVGRLLDAGADLVVCTGSHFIKGVVHEQGKPVAYGLGNHLFSWAGDDTEPVGMHLVAGFSRGNLVQLFAVPFVNTIMAGTSGPLSESAFASFTATLRDRSTTDASRYFSDRQSFENLKKQVTQFRLSHLWKIRARHIPYAFGILYHRSPALTIGGIVVVMVVLGGAGGVVARWMVLRYRRVKRPRLASSQ